MGTKPNDDCLIKSIKIKLGKKEINLTIEEAQKLKKGLEELFGQEVIKEVREEHHHHPWPYPYPWYYIAPQPQPYRVTWGVTLDGVTNANAGLNVSCSNNAMCLDFDDVSKL